MMIRVPAHSLVFGAIGLGVGIMFDNMTIAFLLCAFGATVGYLIWLKARLNALRVGKPFHIGSAINVIICTAIVATVVFGSVVAILGEDIIPGSVFISGVLLTTSAMVILHWRTAHKAGTLRLFPTWKEVGKEAWETATAGGIGEALASATKDVAGDLIKKAKNT
jgi:hypothetical protein